MNFAGLYLRVLDALGPQKRLGWTLALANVALATSQFAEPILFGRIIDALTTIQADKTNAVLSTLVVLLAAWAGFGLFSILTGTLVALHSDRLAHRRRQAVLTEYFEHVLQLPLAYHSGTHSGRLMKVMLQGTDALWAMWLGFFREHMSAFISLLVLLPLSLYLNWRLALLLVVLCVAFATLAILLVRKTDAMQSTVESHYSDLAERASDTLGNIALVQSFARIEAEVSGLRSVTERLLAAQIPVLSWWALATVLTRAGTTLTILCIIITGTWLSIHGLATIGEMVTFMNFAIMVIGRMESTIGFVNTMVWDAPRLREFFEVLDTTPSLRDKLDAVDLPRARGEVVFKEVSFSYDGRMPAVADLSFTAKPGEVIALVGPTGAGKSTSLALLHRAFDPQSGSIVIDGVDLRDIKLGSLRHNIGVVFQETLLFNRSIADNLHAGKPDATEEEMRSAAARAQALDFIDRAPEGLRSRVGERGRMLSGGERQRLSIARALLKDPPILILDEATSALDAATEAKVLAALDEVMKNRTTFVIAHRLATVRKATRILVFENGRVIESGSFDELFARGGAFAALAKAQFMTTDVAAE